MTVYTTRNWTRLKSVDEEWASDDATVVYGYGVFSGTGTTCELETPLATHDCILLTPKGATYNANDLLITDGVVTSNAITITRNSSGNSGLEFWYMLIGTIAPADS